MIRHSILRYSLSSEGFRKEGQQGFEPVVSVWVIHIFLFFLLLQLACRCDSPNKVVALLCGGRQSNVSNASRDLGIRLKGGKAKLYTSFSQDALKNLVSLRMRSLLIVLMTSRGILSTGHHEKPYLPNFDFRSCSDIHISLC
jgi:hypothetical protein